MEKGGNKLRLAIMKATLNVAEMFWAGGEQKKAADVFDLAKNTNLVSATASSLFQVRRTALLKMWRKKLAKMYPDSIFCIFTSYKLRIFYSALFWEGWKIFVEIWADGGKWRLSPERKPSREGNWSWEEHKCIKWGDFCILQSWICIMKICEREMIEHMW